MEIISYTPKWRDKLIEFMINHYPNRSEDYLKWSVASIEKNEKLKENSFLIVSEESIFGCILSLPFKLKMDGKEFLYMFKFNCILNPEIRGTGMGKKLFIKSTADNKENFIIGPTKKAIEIRKKLNDIFVNPARVYISANCWLIKSLYNVIIKKEKKQDQDYIFPDTINAGNVKFLKVKSADELNIPKDGYWLGDKVEFVRDKNFIQNRFFDIYQKYHVYRDADNTCYFVIRSTYVSFGIVSGVEMFSLVDYRVQNLEQEKAVYRTAMRITKMNRVGTMITICSKKHSVLRFCPFTIRTPKQLLVPTAMPIFKPNEKIFITSADADVDFVYYK